MSRCNYGCGFVRWGCQGTPRSLVVEYLDERFPATDHDAFTREQLNTVLDELIDEDYCGPDHVNIRDDA